MLDISGQMASISGYEVPVVALALLALGLMAASAAAGILTRLRRGRVRDVHQGRSPADSDR